MQFASQKVSVCGGWRWISTAWVWFDADIKYQYNGTSYGLSQQFHALNRRIQLLDGQDHPKSHKRRWNSFPSAFSVRRASSRCWAATPQTQLNVLWLTGLRRLPWADRYVEPIFRGLGWLRRFDEPYTSPKSNKQWWWRQPQSPLISLLSLSRPFQKL
jgi:hypothetical protein